MSINSTAASVQSLSIRQLELLLDQLSDVAFCIKDAGLRIVGANAAMADLCGLSSRAEMPGTRVSDFFDSPTSKAWEAGDLQVIRSGLPLRHVMTRVTFPDGSHHWLVISRWPVVGGSNEALAVAMIGRRLAAPARKDANYQRVAVVVAQLQENLGKTLDIGAIARRLAVSVSQLERDFNAAFGASPRSFLTKVRLELAIDLLAGEQSIADVAHACGYKDQSSFSRQFGAAFGMPPSAYRMKQRAIA